MRRLKDSVHILLLVVALFLAANVNATSSNNLCPEVLPQLVRVTSSSSSELQFALQSLNSLKENFSGIGVLHFRHLIESGQISPEALKDAAVLISHEVRAQSEDNFSRILSTGVDQFDVIIIGDGPTAANFAVNLRIANPRLKVLVVTNSEELGGAFAATGGFYRLNAIELPGRSAHAFPNSPIQLLDLAAPGYVMARDLGSVVALNLSSVAEIVMGKTVKSVLPRRSEYLVGLSDGNLLRSRAVVRATGLGIFPSFGIYDAASLNLLESIENDYKRSNFSSIQPPIFEHYRNTAVRATSIANLRLGSFQKFYAGKRIAVVGAGGAGGTVVEALMGYGPGQIYGHPVDGILGEKMGHGIGEPGGIQSLDWWGQQSQARSKFNRNSNGRFSTTIGKADEYSRIRKLSKYVATVSRVIEGGVQKLKLVSADGISGIYDFVLMATSYDPLAIMWGHNQEIWGNNSIQVIRNLPDGRLAIVGVTSEDSRSLTSVSVGPSAGPIVSPREYLSSPTLTWTSLDVLSQRTATAAVAMAASLTQQPAAIDASALGIAEALRETAETYKAQAEFIRASPKYRNLSEFYQFAINYTDPNLTNRQAHSEAVADLARKLSLDLGLSSASQELAAAIGLAHDFGHPVFSHWGEKSIRKHLKPHGLEWDHDLAGVRILTEWSKNPNFMRQEILDGVSRRFVYEPNSAVGRGHLEGQIAFQADRISFNASDIQDGLRIGRFTPADLQEYFPTAYITYRNLVSQFAASYRASERHSPTVNDLIKVIEGDQILRDFVYGKFAEAFRIMQSRDLIAKTLSNIEPGRFSSAKGIRDNGVLVVDFSDELKAEFRTFAEFCREKIFAKSTAPFEFIVDKAIELLLGGAVVMPGHYGLAFSKASLESERIQIIAKYLTLEMTDKTLLKMVKEKAPEDFKRLFPKYENIKVPSANRITDEKAAHDRLKALLQRK